MYAIEQGQIFKHTRNNEFYEVEYANDEIVLLQYGAGNHRMDSRSYFEDGIEAGTFEPENMVVEEMEEKESESSESDSEEVPFEDISWVGEKGADALRSAGIRTVDDVERSSDERILQCQAIGNKALKNIREWVNS